MQSNAGKKNPELTGRCTGGRTGGQEAASEALPREPVSPRGLASASCCPRILKRWQSRDPTWLLQLCLHPRMGPHGMAAPQRVTSLGVPPELWGLFPAAHFQAGCPHCLHHAHPSKELPGSCPGFFTCSRLCLPRTQERCDWRQLWGQHSTGGASRAGVPSWVGQDLLSTHSGRTRAGWDKPQNAGAAASNMQGRTQSPVRTATWERGSPGQGRGTPRAACASAPTSPGTGLPRHSRVQGV